MEDEITYAALREREPALARLEEAARAIRDPGDGAFFCANDAWFDVKRRLRELVGVWRTRAPREAPETAALLGSAAAYEAAFLALYPLLPPCRGCGCALFEPHREEDAAARAAARARAQTERR